MDGKEIDSVDKYELQKKVGSCAYSDKELAKIILDKNTELNRFLASDCISIGIELKFNEAGGINRVRISELDYHSIQNSSHELLLQDVVKYYG